MSEANDSQELDKSSNLTLQDISMMVQIIQECTKRGSWSADELSSVGKLYDRLTSFLQSAGMSVKQKNEIQKDQ